MLREQVTEILSYRPENDQPDPDTATPKGKPKRKRRRNPVPSTIRPRILKLVEDRSGLDGEQSLGDARLHVVRGIEVGCSCPACGQLARVYKRKLNVSMVASLCWLVRKSGPDLRWVHVNKDAPKWVVRQGGELAKLAHWGLVEAQDKDEDDTSKRTSGLWRPTLTGVDFAYDRIEMPTYAYLYDNRCMELSEETCVVRDALGTRFDYGELMSRRW